MLLNADDMMLLNATVKNKESYGNYITVYNVYE